MILQFFSDVASAVLLLIILGFEAIIFVGGVVFNSLCWLQRKGGSRG